MERWSLPALVALAVIGSWPGPPSFHTGSSSRSPAAVSGASGGSGAPLDSAAALSDLRERIRHDRGDVESRRELAALLSRSSDVELRREAVDALTGALRVDSGDAGLWVSLARLQDRRGFRQEARGAYHRALELAPDRPELWSELAAHELRRFQRYHRQDLLDTAAADNRRALALAPSEEDAVARAARIACYEDREASLDSLCTRWREANPGSPWPFLIRGMLYTRSGAWELARDAYESGLSRMTPAERRPFQDLSLVDPQAEREREAAPDSARYWRDFWRWRDPTPADPDNPRLMEHYRRLVEAELYFGQEETGLPGWDHAPGEMIVRYGIPTDWSYRRAVQPAGDIRVSNSFAAPAIAVRYGPGAHPVEFTFVDMNLSGRFYCPIEGVPTDADFLLAGEPSSYSPPFQAKETGQDLEIWRFVDPSGRGRIEVAAALPAGDWPPEVLAHPYRLATKLAVYDSTWRREDGAVASWAPFRKDDLGRLVGRFRVEGVEDSVIVGLETLDRQQTARAAGYAVLAPAAGKPGPALSDVAFLSGVDFDHAEGPYRWGYGTGLPDPGHLYPKGKPLGLAFEAYGLTPDSTGRNHARIRISVGRKSRHGFFQVFLPHGDRPPEAELVFEASDEGSLLRQLLSVALPDLESGPYVLKLSVEDLPTGRSVSTEAPFRVLAPGKVR